MTDDIDAHRQGLHPRASSCRARIPSELTDDTPLITSGILDSIATLKLVTFLEERFGIGSRRTKPTRHLDTLDRHREAGRSEEASEP